MDQSVDSTTAADLAVEDMEQQEQSEGTGGAEKKGDDTAEAASNRQDNDGDGSGGGDGGGDRDVKDNVAGAKRNAAPHLEPLFSRVADATRENDANDGPKSTASVGNGTEAQGEEAAAGSHVLPLPTNTNPPQGAKKLAPLHPLDVIKSAKAIKDVPLIELGMGKRVFFNYYFLVWVCVDVIDLHLRLFVSAVPSALLRYVCGWIHTRQGCALLAAYTSSPPPPPPPPPLSHPTLVSESVLERVCQAALDRRALGKESGVEDVPRCVQGVLAADYQAGAQRQALQHG